MAIKKSTHGGARAGAGRPKKDPTAPPPPDGHVTLAEARRRKEAALAVTRELERDQLAGTLVERVRVEQAAERLGRLTRDTLLGLPVRIAPELAAASGAAEVEALLTQHLRAALDDVARMTAADVAALG